jgi:hypothetical protein
MQKGRVSLLNTIMGISRKKRWEMRGKRRKVSGVPRIEKRARREKMKTIQLSSPG